MGKIKIVSDGTLAGTVFTDETTEAVITGVKSFTLQVATVNQVQVVEVVMTVRQPVLSLEHCEGGLTYV